jgi:hypothetical protein
MEIAPETDERKNRGFRSGTKYSDKRVQSESDKFQRRWSPYGLYLNDIPFIAFLLSGCLPYSPGVYLEAFGSIICPYHISDKKVEIFNFTGGPQVP